MKRGLRVHPSLPIPGHEQHRLGLAVHLSLAGLDDDEVQADADLHAAALVAFELLRHYQVDGGHQIVQTALQALNARRQGQCTSEDVHGACGALAGLFDALLATVTYKRLMLAQVAAQALIDAT